MTNTCGIVGTAVMIATVNVRSAKHPFASVTRMVNVELPTVVGVPDNTPVGESVTPAGRTPVVTPKTYGGLPPLATSVWLMRTPTVALGSDAGSSVIGGHVGGGAGAAAMTSV